MSMTQKIAFTLFMLAPVAVNAQSPYQETPARSVYKRVQAAPSYAMQRPQLTTGARITVFVNFLQQETGVVLLDVSETTLNCQVLEWKPDSVTLQLPRLGIARPQDARLRVIKPNGRVAKTFSVMLVGQPQIVVHEETIPQPMPTAAAPEQSVYAETGESGLTFYADLD